MFLNEDIADIEKPDGICLLTFPVDKFSILFLHPSFFQLSTHSLQNKKGALSNF